jgi:hypothetical protein
MLVCYAAGYGETELVIPEGVTSINRYTFFRSSLINVIIPNSVTVIGEEAFSGADLQKITIPESVTTIEKLAFSGCENLVIRGVAGSYAESYAKKNNIIFEAIE